MQKGKNLAAKKPPAKPLKEKLSASKFKTFKSCSCLYYYRYVEKLPSSTNDGNRVGDCTHIVCECLVKPRHRKHYDAVVAAKDIRGSKVVTRFVETYLRKAGMKQEFFDKISNFIYVALFSDFFCENSLWLKAEQDFDIQSENPRYRIVGFIDQLAEYLNNWIRVKDFKSQKKLFEGDDREANIQGMIYALAVKKLFGQDKKPVVDFLMLNFPVDSDDFRMRMTPTDEELAGLEVLLENVYKQIENFTAADILRWPAKKMPLPKTGEGFKGPLLCGWAGRGFVQSPTQLKKNGDKMFHCEYRFPFEYYALCDEEGKVLRTSHKKDLTADKSKGEFVIKKKHLGCAAFA